MITNFLFILVSTFLTVNGYKVGILLNSEQSEESAAIKNFADYSVTASGLTNIQLEYQYHESSYLSIFDAICLLLEKDVVAVISVSDSTLTEIQSNVLNQFHIPFLASVATNPFSSFPKAPSFEIKLSPSDIHQSEAIYTLLKEYNWFQISILASADTYGINGINHLQQLTSADVAFTVQNVQHFDVKKDLTKPYTEKLFTTELMLIQESVAKVIILNCYGEFAKRILREARDLGLLDTSFVWITTDGITGRPETLAYENSFPTYYHGIIGTVPHYGKGSISYNALKDTYIEHGGAASDLRMSTVRVSEGLKMIDGAGTALSDSWVSESNVRCSSSQTWDHGPALLDELNKVFENGNYRLSDSEFPSYDIMNFKSDSFEKIGYWSKSGGLVDLNSIVVKWRDRSDIEYLGAAIGKAPSGFGNSLMGYHLKIGIVPEHPIAMLNESCRGQDDTSSQECWYGWNPSIIDQLSKDLHFTYEYVMPEDRKYGGLNKETKTWNGMIRDLLDRKTDLTIAMSINTERAQYIQYTAPFHDDQASFVVHIKSFKTSTNMFFFLEPFHVSVWLIIIVLIVVVAALNTLLSKCSPNSVQGKKMYAMQTCACEECTLVRDLKRKHSISFKDMQSFPCKIDKITSEEEEESYLSYYNSTWLVGTGFVMQGTDVLPKSPSGRFILFSWWFFIMILTSMYTANLTAHLTLERSSITIKGLDDLLDQNEYTWGLVEDRNLESLLLNHKEEKYRKIAERGENVVSLEDGIRRVKQGGYVFIDESSVLTFNFKDDCSAQETNTGKFSNQWAFGIQVNSPYANVINNMLLQYREAGWLTSVFDTWYQGSSENSCSTTIGSETKFDLRVLAGLFIILAIGICISFIFVILEIISAAHEDSLSTKKGFWSCIGKRIRLKCVESKEEWCNCNPIKSRKVSNSPPKSPLPEPMGSYTPTDYTPTD